MSKFDDILNTLKSYLPTPQSKNEGTFSMFNLRAVAQAMAIQQNDMEIMNNNWSLDTATGVYLDRVADSYGIYRHNAQYASGSVTFTGSDGAVVPSGTMVQAPDYGVQFNVVGNVTLTGGTGTGTAECTTIGSVGNVPAGTVTVITEQVQGVASVTNAAAFSGGADREEDNNLRLRVYNKIRYPATSGNVYHYQQWATSVQGVGAVKVFPLWDGPGTVKVSILDAGGNPADSDLIQSVQDYIDPDEGKGGGQAPIGAIVTVTTASPKTVNVSATVELGATSSGIEAVKAAFTERLQVFFAEKAYDGETDGVSAALVGRELLDTPGVVDYANLTLNGGTQAVTIGEEEVLQVGTIMLTAAP